MAESEYYTWNLPLLTGHRPSENEPAPVEEPAAPAKDDTFPQDLDLGDTVVFACSGPSLRTTPVWDAGLPVVAVSTAICASCFDDRKPHVWITVDSLNQAHGQAGIDAWKNEKILKVMPVSTRAANSKWGPVTRVVPVPYVRARKHDEKRKPFDGELPLLKSEHKSVLFGIQWLHHVGVTTVIWVGCDLNIGGPKHDQRYGHDGPKSRNTIPQARNLLKTGDVLIKWHEEAKRRGYTWLSWTVGRLAERLEPYEPRAVEPHAAAGG